MMRSAFAVIMFAGLAISSPAQAAYCSAPSTPGIYSRPQKPTPPRKPICLSSYSGANTCNSWEISTYNSEVDRYNRALDAFKSEADRYVQALSAYVRDAQNYAKCEAGSIYED